MKQKLSLSISHEALEILDAAAKANGISRSQMAERGVRALLARRAVPQGDPSFLLSVQLPSVYVSLLDALREIRRMPDWDASQDRPMLALLDDYYGRMSEEDQRWADAQSWRGWPDQYDRRGEPTDEEQE